MIFAKLLPLILALILITFAQAQNIRALLENTGRLIFWTLIVQFLWIFTGAYESFDTNYLLANHQVGLFKAYIIAATGFFFVQKITREGFDANSGTQFLQATCCVGLSMLLENSLYSFLIAMSYCLIFLRSYKSNSLWLNLIFCSSFVGSYAFLSSAQNISDSHFPSAILSFTSMFVICFLGGKQVIKNAKYPEQILFHLCSYFSLFLSFLFRHSHALKKIAAFSFENLLLFQVLALVFSLVLLKAIIEERYILPLLFYWLCLSLLGVFQYELALEKTNSNFWQSWSYISSAGILMVSLLIASLLKDKKTELSVFIHDLTTRSYFSKYLLALGVFLTSSFVFPKSFQFYIFQINHIFMGDIQAENILKLLSSSTPVLGFSLQFISLLFLLNKLLPENCLGQSSIKPKLATKEGISFGILIILGLYFSSLYN